MARFFRCVNIAQSFTVAMILMVGGVSVPTISWASECVVMDGILVQPDANGSPDNTACGDGAMAAGTQGGLNRAGNTAIGSNANAAGDASGAPSLDSQNTAIGMDSKAYGTNSNGDTQGSKNTAIGAAADASGNDSFNTATGLAANASGAFSVNTANGAGSEATGDGGANTATGFNAVANGFRGNNTASGSQSNAEGDDANNDGIGSRNTATGFSASAYGDDSFNTATGNAANASGNNSGNLAAGSGANAIGDNSSNVAVGRLAVATGAGTSNTSVGARSSATHANSSAFGADATTTRAGQQMFGTAGNTYTMAGVNSDPSRNAQTQGPIDILTTDQAGNLAGRSLDSFGFATGGAVAALQSSINDLNKRDDDLAEGIAISLALDKPIFHAGQTFALNIGWGGYDGASAVGLTAAGIVDRGSLGQSSTTTLYGGVGAGTGHGQVAGKAGLSLGW